LANEFLSSLPGFLFKRSISSCLLRASSKSFSSSSSYYFLDSKGGITYLILSGLTPLLSKPLIKDILCKVLPYTVIFYGLFFLVNKLILDSFSPVTLKDSYK
jgi:hypothetical protein